MNPLKYINKMIEMYEGPRITAQEPRTLVADASTEMEQSPDSFLRPKRYDILTGLDVPAETLEDFDVNFRKPNAQGGRIGLQGGQLVQPGPERQGYYRGGKLTRGSKKGQYALYGVSQPDGSKKPLYFKNKTAAKNFEKTLPGSGTPIELGKNPKFTRVRVRPGVGGDTGYDYFIDGKKVSRNTWSRLQDVDYVKSLTKKTLTKKFPKLEERAIELLNEGYPMNDINTKLEAEGIIKVKTVKRADRPGFRKDYQDFNRFYKNLLKEGKLKIKKIKEKPKGTGSMTLEELTKRDDAIVDAFKKNPELSADKIAKRVGLQLDSTIGPGTVKMTLKRRGIDYVTRHERIFEDIKALDKIIKSNAPYFNSNVSFANKNKHLLELLKKATGNKNIKPETLGYRLQRLGKIYAGTASDRFATDLYKKIKPPKNYINSALQKNIIGLMDKQWVGVVEKAELLGLPQKEIDLLEDVYKGAKGLSDIKIAGDHTDIWGIMKNLPKYRENFTRITLISDRLNQLKLETDHQIIRKFNELRSLEKSNNPNIIAQRQNLVDEINDLRANFTKQTDLQIGGPSLDSKGNVVIEHVTERLPNIDSPRATTMRNTMVHLLEQEGVKVPNVVDQAVIKVEPGKGFANKIKNILTKYKGTPEIADSRFIKSFFKMGGKYGKLASAVIGGTLGTVGISTLANAASKDEVTESGMKMPSLGQTAGAAALSKISGKVGGADPLKLLRKIPRKILSSLATPTGALAAWPLAAMGVEKMTGEETPAFDPKSGIERASAGAELALAPSLVKWTDKLTKPIKNQAVRSGVTRLLNLGMSPAMAMRAARLVSPIGWATLGAEGVYQMYKRGAFDKERMMPSLMDKEAYEGAQQEQFDKDQPMFAGGGLANLTRTVAPDSGPMSQGLRSLYIDDMDY